MPRVSFNSISGALMLALAIASTNAAISTASSQVKPTSSDRRASSLTGRVVDESGQPIPNAKVNINAVSRAFDRYRTVSSDEDGSFRFDDLKPGSYRIDVYAGGYYLDGSNRGPTYYRPGNSVSARMMKGGVLTGTVTNATGEPVISVMVTAVRVRDIEGRPARRRERFPGQRWTDDRGVYRLYGLPPGTYLIRAGGATDWGSRAYQDDAPTYHPSATRDGAEEVTLQAGQEVGGIDIRYRAEPGHTVSGSVALPEGQRMFTSLYLFNSPTGSLAAETYSGGRPGSRSFSFHGVPDGEYFLQARRAAYQGKNGAASLPLIVRVKGSDVAGLELALRPTGSIAGNIQLQRLTDDQRKSKCESRRIPPVEESLVFARRENESKPPTPTLFEDPVGAPGEKGDFKMDDIDPGLYHILARPAGEQWFVRSMTLPGPAKGKPPIDAARDGLAIRPDQQVTGLTITFAEGAATLRGRVVAEKQGANLPKRVRVHLIPVEKEQTDEVLRFFEASAQADGAFELTSIQPGRYWMLAISAEEDESSDDATRPRAWDPAVRPTLQSAGETANNVIEFQPCQRMTDQVLRLTTNVNLSPNQNRRKGRRR